jgi:hypothetical protein
MHFVPITNWDVCSALEKFCADAWENVTHGYYKNMLSICLEGE